MPFLGHIDIATFKKNTSGPLPVTGEIAGLVNAEIPPAGITLLSIGQNGVTATVSIERGAAA